MTVADAAEHFKISKEAIHNRIRRGTLNSVIENGVKYVLMADEKSKSGDSRFHDYIEKENERLKARTEHLESEIYRLRDQREQMLIDEREKIEQIYKERDDQLRNVLQVFASKLLPESAVDAVVEEAVSAEIVEEAPVDATVTVPESTQAGTPEAAHIDIDADDAVEEEESEMTGLQDKRDPFENDDFDDLVSLKHFMKLKGYGKKHRTRIKERFKSSAEEDSRILVREGKLFLRPYHFDYRDLLA